MDHVLLKTCTEDSYVKRPILRSCENNQLKKAVPVFVLVQGLQSRYRMSIGTLGSKFKLFCGKMMPFGVNLSKTRKCHNI